MNMSNELKTKYESQFYGKEDVQWGKERTGVMNMVKFMICYNENVFMEPTNRKYVPIENGKREGKRRHEQS